MSRQIEELVQNCAECRKHHQHRAEPMVPSSLPQYPWQKVASDLFQLKNHQYLLVIDYYSRYVEIAKLSSTTSQAIINHLKSIFSRHGIPERVISDNGPQYSSADFANFAREYGFEHVTSSPRYPQANGEAERAVATVKSILEKSKDPYLAMLVYRTTPLQHGYSPAELLMARKLRTTLPTTREMMKPSVPDLTTFKCTDEEIKERQTRDFNKHRGAHELPPLMEGEKVWISDQNTEGIVSKKTEHHRSYEVTTPKGQVEQEHLRHRQTNALDKITSNVTNILVHMESILDSVVSLYQYSKFSDSYPCFKFVGEEGEDLDGPKLRKKPLPGLGTFPFEHAPSVIIRVMLLKRFCAKLESRVSINMNPHDPYGFNSNYQPLSARNRFVIPSYNDFPPAPAYSGQLIFPSGVYRDRFWSLSPDHLLLLPQSPGMPTSPLIYLQRPIIFVISESEMDRKVVLFVRFLSSLSKEKEFEMPECFPLLLFAERGTFASNDICARFALDTACSVAICCPCDNFSKLKVVTAQTSYKTKHLEKTLKSIKTDILSMSHNMSLTMLKKRYSKRRTNSGGKGEKRERGEREREGENGGKGEKRERAGREEREGENGGAERKGKKRGRREESKGENG
ncbi:hypothetical protein QZH41_005646 [Actinostola sp. cb2023]|nr:hypothetical protein QZH41_005646 [Actinostola sp. cb2023]